MNRQGIWHGAGLRGIWPAMVSSVVGLLFARTLTFGFVHADDTRAVSMNPLVTGFLLSRLGEVFTSFPTISY
ncbi:MAG: hypothetical protein ACLFOY_10550 [Desulfatibacillaceae bacterium]